MVRNLPTKLQDHITNGEKTMFKYLVIVQERDDSDPEIVGFGETEEQAAAELPLYADYYSAKVYTAVPVAEA